MLLSVCCFLWGGKLKHSGKKAYEADDVRLLQRQVARNLSVPHQFVCVTDKTELFDNDSSIIAVPIDRRIYKPGTCFAKLHPFSPDAKRVFGDYVLSIDLDSIIVGDLEPLLRFNEDIVLWENPLYREKEDTTPSVLKQIVKNQYCAYNTSVMLHRCGSMCEVYNAFNPSDASLRDDQWYLSDILSDFCPCYTEEDGIWRLRRPDRKFGISGDLPDGARIVTFPGDAAKPWDERTIRENPWIIQHRR